MQIRNANVIMNVERNTEMLLAAGLPESMLIEENGFLREKVSKHSNAGPDRTAMFVCVVTNSQSLEGNTCEGPCK